MNRQRKFHIFLALLLLAQSIVSSAYWKSIEPGVSYNDIAPFYISEWSHIHVFKIDLKQYRLKLISHHQVSDKLPSIEDYAQKAHSMLTFNGGFFDEKNNPLGLRISDFKTSNPFKDISWWGVFSIQNKKAFIQSAKQFKSHPNTEFAIQSGPRLVIHQKIPSLRPGYAERTALCILSKHEIAIVISQFFPMTLSQLAYRLKSEPLNCIDAINLDGGSSTQMLAKFSNLSLYMPGLTSVSDAIALQKR
jgi:uncharacterized protein YigE (DUF2233 family)